MIRVFSESEVAFIRDNRKGLTSWQMGYIIGRSPRVIRGKLSKLGLKYIPLTLEERWKRTSTKKSRSYQKRWMMEYRDEYRKKLHEALGTVCKICGVGPKTVSLPLHQIFGEKHPRSLRYIFKHKEDFVRLCISCHGAVHGLMNQLGLSWNEIQEQYGR